MPWLNRDALSYTSEGLVLGSVGKQVGPLRNDFDQLLERRNHRFAAVLDFELAVVDRISRCLDENIAKLSSGSGRGKQIEKTHEPISCQSAAKRSDTKVSRMESDSCSIYANPVKAVDVV